MTRKKTITELRADILAGATVRRTFLAATYPEGSPERKQLNLDSLTSEYSTGSPYLNLAGTHRTKTLGQTMLQARLERLQTTAEDLAAERIMNDLRQSDRRLAAAHVEALAEDLERTAEAMTGDAADVARGLIAGGFRGTGRELEAAAAAVAAPVGAEAATVNAEYRVAAEDLSTPLWCDGATWDAETLAKLEAERDAADAAARTAEDCRIEAEQRAEKARAHARKAELEAVAATFEQRRDAAAAVAADARAALRVAKGRTLLVDVADGAAVRIVKGKRVPHGVTGTVTGTAASEYGTRVTVRTADGAEYTTNAANVELLPV